MGSTIKHIVKRGGLTDADRDAIFALAGKGLRSGQIALRIERHPSTVLWFMFAEGLQARSARADERLEPYWRKGVLVRPFSAAEDELLLEMREAGDAWPAIAAAIEARFGHARAPRSLKVRATMLASYEAMQEETTREEAACA